jgi:hypothetical protein
MEPVKGDRRSPFFLGIAIFADGYQPLILVDFLLFDFSLMTMSLITGRNISAPIAF